MTLQSPLLVTRHTTLLAYSANHLKYFLYFKLHGLCLDLKCTAVILTKLDLLRFMMLTHIGHDLNYFIFIFISALHHLTFPQFIKSLRLLPFYCELLCDTLYIIIIELLLKDYFTHAFANRL